MNNSNQEVKAIYKLKLKRKDYFNNMNLAKENENDLKKVTYLRLIIKIDSLISELLLMVKSKNISLYKYLLDNIKLDSITDDLKEYAISYTLDNNYFISNEVYYG